MDAGASDRFAINADAVIRQKPVHIEYTHFPIAFLLQPNPCQTKNVIPRDMLDLILGPMLLVVGLLLLDVIPWPWIGGGSAVFERIQTRVSNLGLWGAGLLGFVFALTFCPVSAALFFGSLIPLAVKHESPVLLPSIYGVGTALPVVVFSVILAFAANRLSRAFNALTIIERWMRRITAAVFIVVGGYYCLIYIFGVL
jgi:cytochrome c-type biogenesis protein